MTDKYCSKNQNQPTFLEACVAKIDDQRTCYKVGYHI